MASASGARGNAGTLPATGTEAESGAESGMRRESRLWARKATPEIRSGAISGIIARRSSPDGRVWSQYGTEFYRKYAVRALLHTAFTAPLARAGVSQAAFARSSGYTPRQVNNRARGRAAAPLRAIALAAVLQHTSPEAILITREESSSPGTKPSASHPTPTRRHSGGPWRSWRRSTTQTGVASPT